MKQKESTRLSDYQRIVSYLYEYHHGIKGSNVGFAKIEKRQNRLRVYFHVKTNDQALEYKIYFYYFHQGAMNGIYLDTVKRTDDENTEKTVPPEPSPETETLSETEASPTSSLSEYIEALQLEKDAKEFTHPNPPKDFDWKEYPTLPMPPSYSLDPSIKIGLEDLDQIPDLDDNIKTNGFLLLNYGNFGHLMLAKDQDSGQRYLGIPGIFDNEKAFISRLFGFKTFITVPLKPHKTGNFGYFILPV